MDRESVDVFLPDPEDCYERFPRARFGATAWCVCWEECEPGSGGCTSSLV